MVTVCQATAEEWPLQTCTCTATLARKLRTSGPHAHACAGILYFKTGDHSYSSGRPLTNHLQSCIWHVSSWELLSSIGADKQVVASITSNLPWPYNCSSHVQSCIWHVSSWELLPSVGLCLIVASITSNMQQPVSLQLLKLTAHNKSTVLQLACVILGVAVFSRLTE